MAIDKSIVKSDKSKLDKMAIMTKAKDGDRQKQTETVPRNLDREAQYSLCARNRFREALYTLLGCTFSLFVDENV